MKYLNPEKIKLNNMASGHLCLELSDSIGWKQFPEFGQKLAIATGASVPDKAESVEMRIWHLRFPSCNLKLVYDDFPSMVSLESDTAEGDSLLQSLLERLKAL